MTNYHQHSFLFRRCRDGFSGGGLGGKVLYSLHYFIPDFHGAHEGVICAFLGYGVVPLIFLLKLEGNCHAIRKFALWVAVFQEGAIFEESDVSQSQNVCPSFFSLWN